MPPRPEQAPGRAKQGARTEDRSEAIRIRVSSDEKAFAEAACSQRGMTVSYAIRLAMKRAGILPRNSKLDPTRVRVEPKTKRKKP